MDFVSAVKSGLGKYATFSGRASRSEYWFFFVFIMLVSIVASIIDTTLGMVWNPVNMIAGLALLLPSIGVAVRRLHDTNHSGWWYLLLLVPLAGVIVLTIWFCSRGTEGPNRFGDDPLAETPDTTPLAAGA